MAALTPQQIAAYAYRAGFRGKDLIYAVAIAIRESGGNTKAYNPELAAGTAAGQGSRGLWQIYGSAHPQYNNDSVYDPAKNAEAAFQVYREAGNKFTPWSTWNNGSAQSLALSLGEVKESAMAGITATASEIGTTVTTGVTDRATGAVSETANAVLDGITARILGKNAEGKPRETADIMVYMAGATLILLGIIFLFVKSGAGEATVKVIGKAAAVVA